MDKHIICFKNGIYPLSLFIVEGDVTKKFINSKFKVVNSEEILDYEEEDNSKACVYNKDVELVDEGEYGVLLCVKEKLELKDIAHESVHVAAQIFDSIGAYFDQDNQEPFTYLVSWVAECIETVNKEILDNNEVQKETSSN